MIKVLTSPSKLRDEEHRNYFTDILYRKILKVKRLDNYKSTHKTFKTKNETTQKLFQIHYAKDDHEGKEAK